jgi:hypothetical protein
MEHNILEELVMDKALPRGDFHSLCNACHLSFLPLGHSSYLTAQDG